MAQTKKAPQGAFFVWAVLASDGQDFYFNHDLDDTDKDNHG